MTPLDSRPELPDELATASAVAVLRAVASKAISSRELVDLYLSRIERLDPSINAVATLDAERARHDAARADEATAAGRSHGPLHGLPMTIKDAIEVEGVRSTGGAVELSRHVPSADAPAVARLREAGAVVVGKTNTSRWSGDLQTFNGIFGTTTNPWDPLRSPGGSSGGSAAAVSAGLTGVDIGTDIGGSIRIPSHCCGVFGLKPSFGVVAQRGYLDHVGGGTTDADINVFGPLARSASDLDLVLSVLAGPEPERAPAWKLHLPSPKAVDPAAYRVAVWLEQPESPIDAESLALLRAATDRLSDQGAHVEEVHPDVDFVEQVELFHRLVACAAALRLGPEDGARVGSHYQWLIDDKRRASLRRAWAEWFRAFDVLVCPVMATPAMPHQHVGSARERTIDVDGELRPYLSSVDWTGLIGVLGLPSAVAPVGRTRGELPVGIQVVAPYLRDRDAINVAGFVGHYDPPPMASSVR
jgi:amidase